MGLRSYINIALIPISEVSYSISNAFVKSGKAKISAEHNFSFKWAKTDSYSPPHLNLIDF